MTEKRAKTATPHLPVGQQQQHRSNMKRSAKFGISEPRGRRATPTAPPHLRAGHAWESSG
jgi:hypothetical protein